MDKKIYIIYDPFAAVENMSRSPHVLRATWRRTHVRRLRKWRAVIRGMMLLCCVSAPLMKEQKRLAPSNLSSGKQPLASFFFFFLFCNNVKLFRMYN